MICLATVIGSAREEGLKIKQELLRKILSLISIKAEGDCWDYKQEWHEDNEKLIHDILCFSNTVHNEDCYLIFGVADSGEIIGLTATSPNRKNQAQVLDLLSNTSFAGDCVPKISLQTIKVDDKDIDVLTVHNSFDVPFYLKSKAKRFHILIDGYVYSRIEDRNTPINQNSSIHQIELL